MRNSVLDFAFKVRLPIVIFVAIATYLTTYYISRSERYSIGYKPDQPINFSHKLHAGEMEMDCRYCHTTVDKGRHANVPDPGTCMNCHTYAKTDSAEIIKLTDYYRNKKPIPWKRIHKLPEHVYFNHSVHVNKGISCASCHGNIQNMEKVEQVRPFTMTTCLNCHRTAHTNSEVFDIKDGKVDLSKVQLNKGPENCAACHR